jgi:hypothetical protein
LLTLSVRRRDPGAAPQLPSAPRLSRVVGEGKARSTHVEDLRNLWRPCFRVGGCIVNSELKTGSSSRCLSLAAAAACKHMIALTASRPMDNMDGFDSLTMSYLGNPVPVGLLPHTDFLQPHPGMDMQDHLSNFDTETYMRFGDCLCGLQWNSILTISQCR